jgi:hypothetical protein
MLQSKTRWLTETNYRPELYVSQELGPLEVNYYQSQIGVVR